MRPWSLCILAFASSRAKAFPPCAELTVMPLPRKKKEGANNRWAASLASKKATSPSCSILCPWRREERPGPNGPTPKAPQKVATTVVTASPHGSAGFSVGANEGTQRLQTSTAWDMMFCRIFPRSTAEARQNLPRPRCPPGWLACLNRIATTGQYELSWKHVTTAPQGRHGPHQS